MKVQTDVDKMTPLYFRNKALNIQDRNHLPVDFTCMHLSYCCSHPIDLMYEAMENAASQGWTSCWITAEDIIKNLCILNIEHYIVKSTTKTKGFLWWKKTYLDETTEENPEYIRFAGIMARDILSELCRVLHNKGFNYQQFTMKEMFPNNLPQMCIGLGLPETELAGMRIDF